MRRRLTASFVGLLVALAVLAASLPWWFGFALKHLGPRVGVGFTAYRRLGYSRFAIDGVTVRRGPVVVTIADIQTETPLLWAWRSFHGVPPRVTIGGWSVDVRGAAGRPPSRQTGWMPLQATLKRIAAMLDRWLPDAAAGPGTVRWKSGRITVASAQWRPDELRVKALQYGRIRSDAKVALLSDRIELQATSLDYGFGVSLSSEGPAVRGHVSWNGQSAAVDGRFSATGWIPAEADLQAPDVRFSGDRLKLGSAYSAVAGHAYVAWRTDHFFADLRLAGIPVPGKSIPPLDVTLRGRGDRETFTIDGLHVVLPGVLAELSRPVTIDRLGRIRTGAARFDIQASLAEQPWFQASGSVFGHAQVDPRAGRIPTAEFRLSASGVRAHGVAIQDAEISGQFDWPAIRVRRASMSDRSGGLLEGEGTWDIGKRSIAEASLRGVLRPDMLARWIPSSVKFDAVHVDWNASGKPLELRQDGRLRVDSVRLGAVNPMSLEVRWRGVGTRIGSLAVRATVADGRIEASGSADMTGARIAEFRYEHKNALQLRLTSPARIAWRPRLSIEDLHLAGPAAAVDGGIIWGPDGRIELAVRGLRSDWVRDFHTLPGPAWGLKSLAIVGNWDRGPITGSAAGEIVLDVASDRNASVVFSAHETAAGVRIDALRGSEDGRDVVSASGTVPLTFDPGTSRLVAIHPSGRLGIDASTVPNSFFWQQLARATGLVLVEPKLSLHMTGTWRRPQGRATLSAVRIALDPKRFGRSAPKIDSLDLALEGDAGGLDLRRLSLNIEGQALRASGRLPVPASGWGELVRTPVSYLRHGAVFHIQIPDAEVSMFSRYLPSALAPAGRLQADLTYDAGSMSGYLKLRGAASRPLGPLGVLQGVAADVGFSGNRVILRRVTAGAGGEPVVLSGSVELPSVGWLGGSRTAPSYRVAMKATNLPLVRQAGMLMRGDLDLKLDTPRAGPARITGKVTLHDGLFLEDVRAFLPRGGSPGPARRPPYFSVGVPPLNRWILDVDVSGRRFLRLRTPVFGGLVSARFHLGGTLGEPRAVGEARIDEGRVLMPFATFSVAQGLVQLTEDEPYEPTIYLRGTGRHFGYDLTMEITGKASAPDITFRSDPALDPDQILLMVMTGAAPTNQVNTTISQRAVQIGAYFGQNLLGSLTGSGARPDRLSIESGEKISLQGKETYEIDYRLNHRWTLTGAYDEFDEYNIGFKWRVAPKKLP